MRLISLIMLMRGVRCRFHAQVENFDPMAAGQTPNGWKAGVTGQERAEWVVDRDASAPSPPMS